MSQSCTCGARPPEDARFCHKCGRPLFEMPVVVEEPEEPAIPPPQATDAAAAVQLSRVNWRNPMAVKVGFLAGGVASLLLMIPMPPVFHVIWLLMVLVGVGFWSVYLYRRRTGEHLSVGNGARLGWITGIFCFLVVMVVFTVNAIVIANSAEVRQAFIDMMEASAPEAAALLNSPGGMGAVLVGSLLAGFILLTIASTVGGALGAKILEKE